jgi:hypothetical protein
MKTNFALLTACAFLLGASTMPSTIRAADVIAQAEKSSTGTVSKVDNANKIVTLKFETGTETSYQFSHLARITDSQGRQVETQNVRAGTRLTVFFRQDGTSLIVTHATILTPAVIADNPVPNPNPSQPVDANGVVLRALVMEVLPDSSTIIVKSDTGASIRYRYTKTTQLVDEAGNMVTLDSIRAGTRATMQFTKIDNELVLTRVIVVESGPVISKDQAVLAPVLSK